MTIQIDIQIDNADWFSHPLGPIGQLLRAGAFMAAEWIRARWIAEAQAAHAVDTGAYIRGLEAEGTVQVISEQIQGEPDQPMRWEMIIEITNTAPHASIVEDGHGAFHLPSKVNWSGPRVKVSAKGIPYLHIPFRHSTAPAPGEGATKGRLRTVMPADVQAAAAQLKFRRVRVNAGVQRDARGGYKAADRYVWLGSGPGGKRLNRHGAGNRMTEQGVVIEQRAQRIVGHTGTGANRRALVNPAWKGSKYDGMFRTGPPGHESYMTIRTMTANSQGWNIPAMVGYHLAEKTAQAAQTSPDLVEVCWGAALSGANGGQE